MERRRALGLNLAHRQSSCRRILIGFNSPPLVAVLVLQASLLEALGSSYPYHFGLYGFSQVVKLGTHHFSNPMVLHLNILGSRMKV
jgi:hypothetical protein